MRNSTHKTIDKSFTATFTTQQKPRMCVVQLLGFVQRQTISVAAVALLGVHGDHVLFVVRIRVTAVMHRLLYHTVNTQHISEPTTQT